MRRHRHLGLTGAALLLAACAGSAAPTRAAEDAEWIGAGAAEARAAEMREAKMRLAALDCRQKQGAEAAEFRMRWEPNGDNRQWSWREGDRAEIADQKRKFKADGYRLVSEKVVTWAPSGRSRACALWHR